MKKIFFSVGLISLVLCLGCVFRPVFAAETTTQSGVISNWDSSSSLKRVNVIGTNILAKNKLPNTIVFKVSEDEAVNAYANIDREIYIQKGLLQYVENDAELAAVISHEVGHIVNAHIQRQGLISVLISYFTGKVTNEKAKTYTDIASELSMLKMSRKDEYESDLTGVDLMMAAGYNPLAMISIDNKILANSFDFLSTHPSGDKRTMNIYDYLSYNYPNTVKNIYNTASYRSFIAYAQPTVELRKNNLKAMEKYNKYQAKMKKGRLKRAQNMSGSNPWATTYSVLKAFSAS